MDSYANTEISNVMGIRDINRILPQSHLATKTTVAESLVGVATIIKSD